LKTYKVIRDCTFQKRCLRKDTIVQYEDDIIVPQHLKLAPDEAPVVKKRDDTLSGLGNKQQDLVKPKTGFASSLNKGSEKSAEESQKSKTRKKK
jgi:hypothetical protein